MVQVEFRSVGPGTCSWCQHERDEVFTIAFGDKSFNGPMCKNDLLRAIRMRLDNGNGHAKAAAPAASAGGAGK